MRRIFLLTLALLALMAGQSHSATTVTALTVNGTDLIPPPSITTPYVPAEYDDEGSETTAETKGVATFAALSGVNYTFETVKGALDFARNPVYYIHNNFDFDSWSDPDGYGAEYYDFEYDDSLQATMKEITVSIEISSLTDTVDLSGYSSAIVTMTFTAASPLTAPYGERHFIAGGTSTVTFSGITFNGSDNGGGVAVSDGTVSFTGCTFTHCDMDSGGGLRVSGGTVSVSGTFTRNTAGSSGGAISVTGGTVSVTGTFSGNVSYSGGAISVTGGSLTVSSSSFTGNEATNGGAIYSSSGLTVGAGVTFNTVSASSPNVAERGGAVYIASGTAAISGSGVSFTENEASYGGAVYVSSGTLNAAGEGMTFSGNVVSEDGGAIWTGAGSRVNLTGSSMAFTGNKSVSGDGGGIYASGTVTLSYAVLTENEAETGRGGAIFMAGGSTVNFSSSASRNRASYGGAVYMANARSATNLTVTGQAGASLTQNSALISGGGIYAEANCSITLETELDMTGNTAEDGNGGAMWLTDESQLPEGTVIFVSNNARKSTTASLTEGNGGGIYVLGSDTSSVIVGPTRLYTFEGNSAQTYGGAVFIRSGDVTFDGYMGSNAITSVNTARIGGGFAGSTAGTIRFNNSTVTNQTVTNGSGGAVWARNVVITSCDFGASGSPNMSQGTGNNHGGGAVYSNGTISLSNATFSYNEAVQGGGAVYADTADVTVRSCYFHDNDAQGGNGGAITLRNYCTTTIASTTFVSNESENLDGGAVYAQGRIEISYCYFNLNQSKRSGGAIYFDQSNAQEPFSSFAIRNSMLTENSTQGGTEGGNGGGIFAAANRVTITSCTFNKNHIDLSGNAGEGGGLYLNTANYQTANNRIENCTFYENTVNDGAAPNSDNTVYSGGGALGVHCEGRTEIVSCTFAGNGSRYKGGAIYLGVEDGTLSVSGTMLVGNTNLGIYDIWSDGNISSGGYNRIGVYGTGSGVTDFYSETRNETDRTSYPSKGWSKSTFYSGNVLSENLREDLGGEIPPYVGSSRAGQVRLLTLMLSEDASLPLTDRATNIIPYSRRTSFPDTDERGVSRTAGGEDIALDVGACFFDGTRYSDKKTPVAAYTISRVEISGIPNNLRRVGQTASLIAKVYYTNGRTALGGNGDGEEPIEWTSDKPNIIRINKDTGDIVVLSFTPGETYVTITATTIRTDLNGARISSSKPIKVTEYTASYLNTSPELMNYLQGYTEQLTEYDISVRLSDADNSAVNSAGFQAAFADTWNATASQVMDLTAASIEFDTRTGYTASDGYALPSGKAGVSLTFSGLGTGDIFPLIYTWDFTASELAGLLGFDMAGREITSSLADEIFTRLRIDFEGSGSSRAVIGGSGVKASDAMTAGALSLTKTSGSGLHAELTAYLANVTASGLNDGPRLVDGLLVVPDGSGNDGAITGTMWMAGKTSSQSADGQPGTSSGSGGGGCLMFPAMTLLALAALRRRH
ncbi:MAG: hypothetical protein IJP86_00190 [Synergistaceae bacterium]|nr:hypothetical protein [Synergistaceae bacterium]